MPLSLVHGVPASPSPAFFLSSDRPSETCLPPGFRLPRTPPKLPLCSCFSSHHTLPRHSASCRRRSKLLQRLITVPAASDRNVAVRSMDDLHTLVLERRPDDADLDTDEGSATGPRRVEVVGSDLDLEEEISRLRNSGMLGAKKRKKRKEISMESWDERNEDPAAKSTLVTKEVRLRSEGDASNLAGLYPGACEELITRENQTNGTAAELIDFKVEEQTSPGVDKSATYPFPNGVQQLTTLPGGGQLVADLTNAWDGLSGRLPRSLRSGKFMQQLMSALKLTLSAARKASRDGKSILAHSLSIAYTLADLQMDGVVIAAGILRPAVEAGLVNIAIVSQDLGTDISRLLYDCMRVQRTIDQMDLFDEESARAVRQFCLSYHDIRSIIIEFSARLHIMRRVDELPRFRQQILALEALQVHAPLAHATGSKEVSTELEDLAFKVIFPESYESLDNWLSSHWPDGNIALEECKMKLSVALMNDGKLNSLIDDFTISGRVKSRFSTMKKLLKDGRQPNEIYDILGLRVVLKSQEGLDEYETTKSGQEACYRVLEIVRSIWEEVPGRLKDYISRPKPNGYKSLHVAVQLSDLHLPKQPTMELQIRTSVMDFIANDGDASHSLYKGGLTDPDQVQQVKKLMMAAADHAALSLKELTGEIQLMRSQVMEDPVFMMFDKNNDGKISMAEIKQVMDELGAEEQDAHELMQLVDTNRDGSVSAEEFADFKKQVRVLQGFDKEFSYKLDSTLGDANTKATDQLTPEYDVTKTSNAVQGERFIDSSDSATSKLKAQNADSIDLWRTSYVDQLESDAESLSLLPSVPSIDIEQMDPSELSWRNENGTEVVRKVGNNLSTIVIKKPGKGNYSGQNIANGAPARNPDSFRIMKESNGHLRARPVAEVPRHDLEMALKSLRHLISKKNVKSAKQLAKQLYQQYPHDTDVLVEYAYVERLCEDFVTAGALYAEAITIFENQRNLGYDYIRALQALGAIEAHARNAKRARILFVKSIQAAEKAEETTPDMIQRATVYGLHSWARLEEQLGNWKEAKDLLSRAAKIQPGNAVVHQSRALLEAKAHNWGIARHHFRLAVKANPKDVKCWHAWALFESRQGKQQKMRQLFSKALEIDPKNVYSLQAWACQEALGDTIESREIARSLFRRCTEIEPENLHSWQAWAVMENVSGNYDEARNLFEKCIGLNPSCITCIQSYAKMERNLGNLVAAQRLLRRALQFDPENAAVLMEAAFVEKSMGDNELAEKLFVLAGMADKRKSRVRHKIFMSRKESRTRKTRKRSSSQKVKSDVHTREEESFPNTDNDRTSRSDKLSLLGA